MFIGAAVGCVYCIKFHRRNVSRKINIVRTTQNVLNVLFRKIYVAWLLKFWVKGFLRFLRFSESTVFIDCRFILIVYFTTICLFEIHFILLQTDITLLSRLLIFFIEFVSTHPVSRGFFFMWENLWSNRKTWGWNFRYKYPLHSFALTVRVWPHPLYYLCFSFRNFVLLIRKY